MVPTRSINMQYCACAEGSRLNDSAIRRHCCPTPLPNRATLSHSVQQLPRPCEVQTFFVQTVARPQHASHAALPHPPCSTDTCHLSQQPAACRPPSATSSHSSCIHRSGRRTRMLSAVITPKPQMCPSGVPPPISMRAPPHHPPPPASGAHHHTYPGILLCHAAA